MPGLRKVLLYMLPYRWVAAMGILTVVLPVLMELIVPRMLQLVIDQGIRDANMDAVWQGAGVMLGAAMVGAITTLGQGICRAQISQGIAFDLRNDLFRHIGSLSFANLDRLQTGQLITRISSDVNLVRMFLSAGIALLLRVLLMIIGSLVMIFWIDWSLALIVLGLVAIAAIIIRMLLTVVSPLFDQVQRRLGALNTVVQENLAGVRVVKAYAREPHEIDRFEDSNSAYRDHNIRVGRYLAIAMPLLLILTNVGTGIIIWQGGLDVIGGRLTIGELVAFTNYLMIGMAPLLFLSNLLSMVSRAEASALRVVETLETEPIVRNPEQPVGATPTGRVSFEDVSFFYTGSERDRGASQAAGGRENGSAGPAPAGEKVLDRVRFEARPGETIALLGATGSGKSTLVSLIPRFYDVTQGAVCVDGIDVRSWDLERLRRSVGVVPQQTLLFGGTIRENIAYGRPEASQKEVEAAARAAQAHSFISALPDGYENPVEARGANLSGGQRQRIAIARALLLEPSILILDDATSAVDLDTEARIQAALAQSSQDMTTFVIAQRITSVIDADRILVLDRGRIVAQGDHATLLKESPLYQEIYSSQLGDPTEMESQL